MREKTTRKGGGTRVLERRRQLGREEAPGCEREDN